MSKSIEILDMTIRCPHCKEEVSIDIKAICGMDQRGLRVEAHCPWCHKLLKGVLVDLEEEE